MKTIFGLCMAVVFLAGCRGSDFQKTSEPKDKAPKKPQSLESSIDAEQSLPADNIAAEPVPVGGSYLRCMYQEQDAQSEILCRLEKDEQPILMPNPPASQWRIAREGNPMDLPVRLLDLSTGWQWGFTLPSPGDVGITVQAMLSFGGQTVAYETTIAPSNNDDDTPEAAPAPTPAPVDPNAPLNFQANFGNGMDFVVGTDLSQLSPSDACYTQVSGPIFFKLFQTGQALRFTFTVLEDNTRTTIRINNICGQQLPNHVIEVRGPNNFLTRTNLPVGAKVITVMDKSTLAAGTYELSIESRFGINFVNDAFIFDELLIESSKEIRPESSRSGSSRTR